MPDQIPICLVTGFLGAGKTTLLKQIIARHADRKIVYLVNEFSPRDIDGAIVADKTSDVITIPGGSIFCTCLVTTFITQLRQLAEQHKELDGIVIEASGMANPKVIHQMLSETQLDHQYRIARIITVVDPGSFHKLRKTLPGIIDQIKMADIAMINKSDCFDASAIEQTKAGIRDIKSEISLHAVSHCQFAFSLFPQSKEVIPPHDILDAEYARCRDPNYKTLEIAPVRSLNPQALKALLDTISEDLFRLKGYINWKEQCYYVDWNTSGFTATPIDIRKDAAIVCIHRGVPSAALDQVLAQLQA